MCNRYGCLAPITRPIDELSADPVSTLRAGLESVIAVERATRAAADDA
jgi:hypothetical protein